MPWFAAAPRTAQCHAGADLTGEGTCSAGGRRMGGGFSSNKLSGCFSSNMFHTLSEND